MTTFDDDEIKEIRGDFKDWQTQVSNGLTTMEFSKWRQWQKETLEDYIKGYPTRQHRPGDIILGGMRISREEE